MVAELPSLTGTAVKRRGLRSRHYRVIAGPPPPADQGRAARPVGAPAPGDAPQDCHRGGAQGDDAPLQPWKVRDRDRLRAFRFNLVYPRHGPLFTRSLEPPPARLALLASSLGPSSTALSIRRRTAPTHFLDLARASSWPQRTTTRRPARAERSHLWPPPPRTAPPPPRRRPSR